MKHGQTEADGGVLEIRIGARVEHVDLPYTALQSQRAVSSYFTSEQVLPFGLAEQYSIAFPQLCLNDTLTQERLTQRGGKRSLSGK